jgi:hypothetical protein
MRFVFAAGLTEVAAARDGCRFCEGDTFRLVSIWFDFRVLNRPGQRETSENPTGFHGMTRGRHRLVRWIGKSRSLVW